MFFQQLDVVCPNATAGPRLRTHEDEYGISALIWGDGTSALVLIVDRRAANKGRSATNAAGALVRLVFEQALEPRALPWCNIRWVERDSEGHFDHMLVDSWPDDGVPRLGFSPCGRRDIDSFKNYVKAMGFVLDRQLGQYLQTLFDSIDNIQSSRKSA